MADIHVLCGDAGYFGVLVIISTLCIQYKGEIEREPTYDSGASEQGLS